MTPTGRRLESAAVERLVDGASGGGLRLAGGDNAIGMIRGDLEGSEQSEVREQTSFRQVSRLL